jgi:cyclic pyranopterin phosphate synthase
MINITHKSSTLRKAIAQAIVSVSRPETILAVKNRAVPKGDVLEMAKTAGLFAAKRTADMIPDCHPLPIEFTSVSYEIGEMEIRVIVEIHTIYKTGVEVEAMHAASVVALTMYDMLKPIDKCISIQHIKLLEKRGGKSDQKSDFSELKAAVVVCSDSISQGVGEDKSGKVIISKLENLGVEVLNYTVIPDDSDQIQTAAHDAGVQGVDILIYTGGTGLSPRDITPEALLPILNRRVPGVEEAMRSYGQQRVPTAMMSRSVAGTIGKMLVLALPGSAAGAGESMDAVFPAIFHVFPVLAGAKH